MSLTFYLNGRETLELSETDFQAVRHTLAPLRQRAGVEVDPYRTCTLAPEHAAVWHQALVNARGEDGMPDILDELIRVLEAAIAQKDVLLIEGE